MAESNQQMLRFKQMVDREVRAYANIWKAADHCVSCPEQCPLLPVVMELSNLRYETLLEKAAALGVENAGLEGILSPTRRRVT